MILVLEWSVLVFMMKTIILEINFELLLCLMIILEKKNTK